MESQHESRHVSDEQPDLAPRASAVGAADATSATAEGGATPEGAALPPARDPDRWLRILHRVTEGAIAHLDIQDLLRELLSRVKDAMEVDNAAILLLAEDGHHLTVYAARGPEEQVTSTVRVGRGIAGRIAASAKPLIVDDISQVEVENPLLRATIHSLVGAPLLVEGRVIGVIHVGSTQPRRFSEDDAHLLEVIAGRIALAIQHAQLYRAEREARRAAEVAAAQLRALQAISDAALAHTGLTDLLDALLDRIRQTMEVDNVAILLPTPDGSELTLHTVLGPEEAVLGQVHVPMGQGFAGRVAARREPYLVEDLARIEVANPFLKEAFTSVLGVPLLIEDRLVGVIHVATRRRRRFSDMDTHLLQALAERIALAIDRAQTYEDVRRAGAEAASQAAALREATRRMDEFLSMASHELRTPLTSLMTNLQLLDAWLNQQRGRRPGETMEEYLPRAVARVQPLIQHADHSIARLDRLVGDLLDASRVREERLELRLHPADLVVAVREAVEEMRQIYPDRTIALEIPPSRTSLPVLMDTDRVGQVLTNLVSNALKYSDLLAPVTIRVGTDGDRALVWVSDQGVGLPRDEHERIWERFYRVDGISHQSGSQVGLGLGLYIVRDIVTRHGGVVGVESAPGAGSTFWFALSLANQGPAAAASQGTDARGG